MNDESLKQSFAEQFMSWKFEQVKNEVKSHYYFLKMLENLRASQIVKVLESLNQSASEHLMLALVKSASRIPLSTDEQRAQDCFLQRINSSEAIIKRFELHDLVVSEYPSSALIKKRNLKVLLKEQLHSVGELIQVEPNGLYYEMLIKNWNVSTWVLFGNGGFTYEHHIVARRAEKIMALSPPVGISVGLWLGFDSQLTTWEFLTTETANEAVSNLSMLCQHFISALPDLLSDIEY